jgi:hypothetical protein
LGDGLAQAPHLGKTFIADPETKLHQDEQRNQQYEKRFHGGVLS